jgi:hypothetical protein
MLIERRQPAGSFHFYRYNKRSGYAIAIRHVTGSRPGSGLGIALIGGFYSVESVQSVVFFFIWRFQKVYLSAISISRAFSAPEMTPNVGVPRKFPGC